MAARVEKSVDIHQPVRLVYNQWTQFEDWPLFMDDVERVDQLEDDLLVWHVATRGVDREWHARITEQIPDKRIAWTSVEGPKHSGVVTFHRLDDDLTRVMLQLDFVPEGFFEGYADKMRVLESWIEDELGTFKEFIEDRGKATGAWRGEIDHHADEPESGATVTAEEDEGPRHEEPTTEAPTTGEDQTSPTDEETPHRAVDHRGEAAS